MKVQNITDIEGFFKVVDSVSYTHLDVYKRQTRMAFGTPDFNVSYVSTKSVQLSGYISA